MTTPQSLTRRLEALEAGGSGPAVRVLLLGTLEPLAPGAGPLLTLTVDGRTFTQGNDEAAQAFRDRASKAARQHRGQAVVLLDAADAGL